MTPPRPLRDSARIRREDSRGDARPGRPAPRGRAPARRCAPGLLPPALATLLAAVLVAVIANGCASPRPEPEPPSTMSVLVPVPLPAALATLRVEAIRLGGRVTSETADSFTADFGVDPRRIGVTTADALGAARTEWHETEVHSSATYFARPTDEGTLVSVAQEASWWHPDRRVWLRLPAGTAGSAGFPAPR